MLELPLRLVERWQQLCRLAHERQLEVFLNYSSEVPATSWDGLWLHDPELGRAIALSSALDLAQATWVLAHELGHEFTCRALEVEARGHVTNQEDQKRWGQGRVREPDEEQANLWAAQELITPEEWRQVEKLYPGSLQEMARHLELPVAAALWRARAEQAQRPGGLAGVVVLSSRAQAMLAKPVKGEGGHQNLLRRVQQGMKGKNLRLLREDFDRMREYLVRTRGGYSARYRAVMESAVEAIQAAGGPLAFFRP